MKPHTKRTFFFSILFLPYWNLFEIRIKLKKYFDFIFSYKKSKSILPYLMLNQCCSLCFKFNVVISQERNIDTKNIQVLTK